MRSPLPALLFALTAAACSSSSPAPVDDALQQDLNLIGGSSDGLILAPGDAGARTVSSLEQVKPTNPQPAPSAPRPSATPRQAPEPAPAIAEAEVHATPQPAPEQPVVTPRPTATRRPQPVTPSRGGNGGYKTVEEVIRDAPFPINP